MPWESERQPEAECCHRKNQQQQGDQHQTKTGHAWPAVAKTSSCSHDRQALNQAQGGDVDHRRQHNRASTAKRCHQQAIEKTEFTVKHHWQASIECCTERGEHDHTSPKEASVAHAPRQEPLRRSGKQSPEQHEPDQRLQNPGHQRGRAALQLQKQSPGEGHCFLNQLGRRGTRGNWAGHETNRRNNEEDRTEIGP